MRATHGWWMPLLLGLAIALAYANGLAVGFHFDDWHVIQKNPHVRSLASIPSFFVDPDSSSVSRENRLVRPLLLVSFALNYAVSGERPWSYHLLNLLLHWCVVLLVFRIVRDHFWLGDAALPVAAGAALVVAVHPLNTSAVDYVTARSVSSGGSPGSASRGSPTARSSCRRPSWRRRTRATSDRGGTS